MSNNNDEMRAKVEARRQAEASQFEAKGKAGQEVKPTAVLKLEVPDKEIEGYLNENRVGDAKLYSRLHRGKVVYVNNWGKFLVWAGHHWEEDHYNVHAQLISDVCDLYEGYAEHKQQEADEETDKDIKAAVQTMADSAIRRVNLLRDIPGQDKLMDMITRIENPLIALPDQFDKQYYLKACPNGVIDLRTGELLPGHPDQYLLKYIRTEYDPALLNVDDPCPEVTKYLQSSLDNQDVVDFIWRLLGYGLITKRLDHIFVIFWGEHGRNGKDTLSKLITHVLGEDLSVDVNVEMFLQTAQTRSNSSSTPDVMELRGACIAWINEAEENQRFALAKLKKMTGGGYINARGNYEREQSKWIQTHLPIMTTNELPKAKADDAPFWARALIVKWPFSFVENPEQPYERQADKYLDDKVQAEAKGVLARMVRGAMEYLRDGLNVPEIVKQWTREQRLHFDDVGQFIEEWCEMEPHQENPDNYVTKIAAGDLHEAFCIWYARNRDKRYSISAKKFAELLNKKEIPYKRSNGSWRLGIQLNAEGEDALEAQRARM